MQNSQSGQLALDPKEEEAPWFVKYGARGLGTFAGGLAMLLGALNLVFSIFSPMCIIFSIWQMIIGFAVVTIESPCCCMFVDHVHALTERIEAKPLWIKALIYFVAPLPSIIFCVGFYTVIGGGLILATGVVYGLIALGKKASREEMARTAHQTFSPGPQYQQHQPNNAKTENVKSSGVVRDPVQAAAAQWASQSSTPSTHINVDNTVDAPPPYSSYHGPAPAVGWDQSFVSQSAQSNSNISTSNRLSSVNDRQNVNVTSNPFQ